MKFDMKSCSGCTTCEMACSFHHNKEFNPAISSIRVVRKMNEAGFLVLVLEENDGKSMACDFCSDLEIPLCAQYCTEKEELTNMIKELKQKVDSARSR